MVMTYRLLVVTLLLSVPYPVAASVWTSGGPYGGTVTALAIDPTTPSTLYAGTPSGVFKSTNSGRTWIATVTGLTNRTVRALAINPASQVIVFAGTVGGGAIRSTNSGGSWVPANTGLNPNVHALAIDP